MARPAQVVGEGLRLVEEREARLQALRHMLDASINEGCGADDHALQAVLDAKAAELAKAGF